MEMVWNSKAKWSAGMSEHDGVVWSVTDIASTCVLCPRFEEPDVC